jgi:hypothetical protein
MTQRNLISLLAMTIMATVFAQGASAACGKQLLSRLAAAVPGAPLHEPSSSPAFRSDESSNGAITGLWLTNVILGGQVIIQSFESFTGEGLEFLNDNGSPLEGNVCFGVWSATGRNTIRVYHPSWNYDAGGNLIGTVVIKEQITLDPGGNTFKGTVVVDTFDLNGHPSAPELKAQIAGMRINPSN